MVGASISERPGTFVQMNQEVSRRTEQCMIILHRLRWFSFSLPFTCVDPLVPACGLANLLVTVLLRSPSLAPLLPLLSSACPPVGRVVCSSARSCRSLAVHRRSSSLASGTHRDQLAAASAACRRTSPGEQMWPADIRRSTGDVASFVVRLVEAASVSLHGASSEVTPRDKKATSETRDRTDSPPVRRTARSEAARAHATGC